MLTLIVRTVKASVAVIGGLMGGAKAQDVLPSYGAKVGNGHSRHYLRFRKSEWTRRMLDGSATLGTTGYRLRASSPMSVARREEEQDDKQPRGNRETPEPPTAVLSR